MPTAVSISPQRDHPVGVPYGGALDGAPRGGGEFRPASRGMVDGRPAWWVSRRGSAATRTRGDLPLFSRSAEDPVPLIECGTCHDPHVAAPLFLRPAARERELCLTCHDK
jgi:predicted CXXCH cytochrome family protein